MSYYIFYRSIEGGALSSQNVVFVFRQIFLSYLGVPRGRNKMIRVIPRDWSELWLKKKDLFA